MPNATLEEQATAVRALIARTHTRLSPQESQHASAALITLIKLQRLRDKIIETGNGDGDGPEGVDAADAITDEVVKILQIPVAPQ